ncbi:MAG: SDR family NAD(P)-dependent oxidoreductase [Frankia sp.]|nr:SDR family NAD(P)-dependent oxidoreductase [Frankia sp.]
MSRTVSFPGTTAVVTGGASGIGKGMARAFLAAGCHVVIADLDEAALAATAAELCVLGVPTDVTDPDSVAALAERAVAEYGEVHVLCNNAGVGPFGAVSAMSLADWRWVLDVNLYGAIHGLHAFLPVLERNPDWGHVVNTSSLSVMVTPPHTAAYVASKAALLGISEVLAAELRAAGSRVGVTALIPGTVRTNIRDSLRTRRPAANGQATGESGLYQVDLAESGRDFRWLDPDEVGAMVLDAIRADQLYLITHPEFADQIAQRYQQIAAGLPLPS